MTTLAPPAPPSAQEPATGDGLGNVASARNAWVQAACQPVDAVGGGQLYDCAGAS